MPAVLILFVWMDASVLMVGSCTKDSVLKAISALVLMEVQNMNMGASLMRNVTLGEKSCTHNFRNVYDYV